MTTLEKAKIALAWVEEQIEGEMIEVNKDGLQYYRTHLSLPCSIAQWELDFICAGINNLLLGMGRKERLDNRAGEFRWVKNPKRNLRTLQVSKRYDQAIAFHRSRLR